MDENPVAAGGAQRQLHGSCLDELGPRSRHRDHFRISTLEEWFSGGRLDREQRAGRRRHLIVLRSLRFAAIRFWALALQVNRRTRR